MKKTTLLLAVLLCASMNVPALAHKDNKSIGEVPQYTGEIVIDGQMDEIYEYGLRYTADQEVLADTEEALKPDPTAGVTAELYTLYNGSMLYYYIEVEDPELMPHDTGVKLFRNECLEIAWDFTNAGDTEDSRWKYMIPADSSVAFETRGPITTDAVTIATYRHAGGYSIELALDTSKVDGVSIAPGAEIGFVYFIDDIRSDGGYGVMPTISNAEGYHAEVSNTPLVMDYFVLGTTEAVLPSAEPEVVVEEVVEETVEEVVEEAAEPEVIEEPEAAAEEPAEETVEEVVEEAVAAEEVKAPQTFDAGVIAAAAALISAAGYAFTKKR